MRTKEDNARREVALKWLQSLCAKHGSQVKIATEAGIPQPTISNVIRGKIPITPLMVSRIAKAFPNSNPPAAVTEMIAEDPRFALGARASAPVAPVAIATTAPTAPTDAASPIGDALARVQSLLSANVAGSQRAARRVVECAERYALAVEQAQAHRLLVFVGAATGEEPTAQTAALALYDALLGVPELAALLTQPAPKPAPKVTAPLVPMAPETPAAEPAHVQPDPYEVVVTCKPDAPAIARTIPSEPADSASLRFPALAAASSRNPLLIVGGVPIPEKIQLLHDLGVHTEWVAAQRGTGTRLVEAAVQRVKATRACAVIVPHGFVGHRDYSRMRNAARHGVVPFESPKRMGDADFARTLHALDTHFAKQAS